MHDLHTFYFNGHFLHELGAVITQPPTLIAPKRDVEFFSIPGKSGDSIIDNGRYENKTLRFPIRAVPTFCNLSLQDFKYKLSDWLQVGDYNYKEYRDTYNPGYFRKGVVTEIEETVAVERDVYETAVTFNFDPFLYSDAGRQVHTYSSSLITAPAYLQNPEKWESEPIIKVSGNGMFTVSIGGNSFTITLESSDGEITIDKPSENVYDSDGNDCNGKISAMKLPTLKAGKNKIQLSALNYTDFAMKIIPNWRRL